MTKYTLTFCTTRWEATQRVMAAKLTRLIHKIAIQLHLVAESCTICSYRSRRPIRRLLDTPSYKHVSAAIILRISVYYFKYFHIKCKYTRAVWKVRGLTLLLRVETLWRCGDCLFFLSTSLGKRCTSYNAPPTPRKSKRSNKVNPRTFQTALVVAPPS
jgi:hypothetical protein